MLDTLVAAVGPELADAVAIALALDPRDRYQTAREMGRAISDGARGISPVEPPTAATRRSGDRGDEPAGDRAASVLSGGARGSSGAQPGAVTPRRPRPGPPRQTRPERGVRPPPHRLRPPGAGRGRLLLALLVLLALAVVIVAVVIATAPAPTKVVLRNVVYSDVQQASSALKQLVAENTK